ncbi:MAG TPA: cytochrome P450 [Steroidobacteraceae bacterium]|jgi:cytochrome P450|nr:cytochrome P450 [Steroidobacteraceae bacterium]
MNEQVTELVPSASPGGYKPIPTQRSSVLGQILSMRKDLVGHLQALEKIHGSIWKIAIGRGGMISLLGPDALEFVWKNRDGAFSSARGWEPYIGKVFPGAIMAMDGDQHRYQRRIMQVAFRKSALRTYLTQMGPAIEAGIDAWLPTGERSAPRRMFPLLKQLTLDLAASVFMGIELGQNAKHLNRAFMATVAASLAIVRVPVPGLSMWRGIRGRALLVRRFRELLPKKRATHTGDFFSEFCHVQSEQGERFTDQEIIDHMIFLMMAAHDTTTSTLTTMMYLLARHPEWQQRLRTEAMALQRTQLEFDDLDRLEELSWVMREALRLTPPLTSMPRMCVKDTVFQGCEIPAGMLVGVYPIHVHYMDSLWTDPFKFDPERFSAERQEDKRHGFAWVPFGGGAHMCIGQHFATLQVKAIMHQLLRKFSWSIAAGYVMPYQLVPIAKPKDGLQATLRRIDAA